MAAVATAHDAPRRKLAERVAAEIERDIIRRGWPIGTSLGSEVELLERYGVGRAVFREAVRLLEHHSVARMRKGPGGGLVVTEPNLMVVAESIAMYLEYHRVEPRHVFETRKALELMCVEMVAERLDERGVQLLRELAAAEIDTGLHGGHSPHDWHVTLAELSGNPSMALFVTILARLTREHLDVSAAIVGDAEEIHRAHTMVTEALVAGDVGLAKHRMKRHLEIIENYLQPAGPPMQP